MRLSRIGNLAVLVALCVLTIFFFPAIHGPYSVVHGPVTALQASRAASRLRVAIIYAALFALPGSPASASGFLTWTPANVFEIQPEQVLENKTVLRC
jgi:hypothetical protein